MSYVLSVDPGKNVGYAYWKSDGTLVSKGVMDIEDFIAKCSGPLLEAGIEVIVYEDYTLRPNKAYAQRGSKLQASQIIGAVKLLAKLVGAKLVRQQPKDLKITALHAGVVLPKGHLPDELSAYLHGYRYFVVNEIIKPKLQEAKIEV